MQHAPLASHEFPYLIALTQTQSNPNGPRRLDGSYMECKTQSADLQTGGGLMTSALIALEGPKAAGKTTICNLLSQRLVSDDQQDRVVLTKEPTAGFNLAQETRLTGLSLARAIADDRATHLREVIAPALVADKVVICDRYILSSLVFHGADGVATEQIWQLNESFPLPDLNLLITADADTLLARRAVRETLTRLEATRHPADELADYARYAEAMKLRGVDRISVDNTKHEDLANVVELIMKVVTKAVQP